MARDMEGKLQNIEIDLKLFVVGKKGMVSRCEFCLSSPTLGSCNAGACALLGTFIGGNPTSSGDAPGAHR